MSRGDGAIVARHEVPGIIRKIARPSGTIEAAGAFDALSLAHAGAQFRRQISVGLTMTSTVPPGRDPLCIATRHFVPGYDQSVPPGRSENRLPNVRTVGA